MTFQFLIDGSKDSLENLGNEFLSKVPNADVIMVFYAGHGVQIGGINYLIPVGYNSEGTTLETLKLYSINDMIISIEKRAHAKAAKIFILDACRDNPWRAKDEQGLAALSDDARPEISLSEGGLPKGYFRIVAFATAAGTLADDGEGRNSPFTKSLLKHISTQGLSVSQILQLTAADVIEYSKGKQRPEYLIQTSRRVFFRLPHITDCDRYAAEDGNSVGVKGMVYEDIVPKKAIPACAEAIQNKPDSPRINYYYARALERGEKLDAAFKHYKIASDLGFPGAIHALGIMYLGGCGVERDIKTALGLMSKAQRRGYLYSKAALTQHDMLKYLKPDQVSAVQKALKRTGFYQGEIDGKAGSGMREAIKAFQTKEKLTLNGFTLETAHNLGVPESVPPYFDCH